MTRDKILNAAEALFAQSGFASVSLREITTRAEVTLALSTYHFGTKEKLLEAIVARRADILCDARQARLSALQNPSVRDLLDAFMAPMFEKATSDGPEWADYFRVLARLGGDNQWLDVLARHFDETAKLFVAALMKAMPSADRGHVARAFTMVLQIMLATVSKHGRVDMLTEGSVEGGDLDSAYPVLLQFVTHGLESFNQR
ncbi:TetR/AcrR family transcriptional regulator [Devosia sp. SL43]|uniref:TetR/AcrR family transcriptional regulator n=1 Tax=Devosia sp. SL43 TaxID=2806348 RepID=UPI001F00613A|nr:TetR/AcrR family transcriptional regulator [Devosia sp. SL43]UJW87464.1 TetR family transcriptional regulator [Devosia sp. SL43]